MPLKRAGRRKSNAAIGVLDVHEMSRIDRGVTNIKLKAEREQHSGGEVNNCWDEVVI